MNTFLKSFVFLAEAGPPPFNLGVGGAVSALIGIIEICLAIGWVKDGIKSKVTVFGIGLSILILGILCIVSALIHGAKNEVLNAIRNAPISAERTAVPKDN